MISRQFVRRLPLPLVVGFVLLALTAVELGAARAVQLRAGLAGRYWAGANWAGPVIAESVDPDVTTERIAFIWPWRDTPFSVRWDGFVLVRQAGPHRFATVSDDGSAVWVDGQLVVDNGGAHSARLVTGTVDLTRGPHEIRVEFQEFGGSFEMRLLWAKGDEPLRPLAAGDLRVTRPATNAQFVLDGLIARGGRFLAFAWLGPFAWLVVFWAVTGLIGVVTRRELGDGLPASLKGVLALSVLLNVAGLWWGEPGGGWAPDELTPKLVLGAVAERFSNGWASHYPPLHFYVLALTALPLSLMRFAGCCGLEAGLVDSSVIDPLLTVTFRMVSVAMAFGIVLVTYVCGRYLFDRRSALWAALIFSLTSPFVFYAKLANVDVPYLFWYSVAFLAFLRIRDRGRGADYLLFAGAATLAVCTKDQAYGLFVLPALAVVWLTYQRAAGDGVAARVRATLADRRLLGAVGLAAALFAAAQNFLWNLEGFATHVRIISTLAPARIFEPTVGGQVSMMGSTLWLLRLSLGWPLFILGVSGVALVGLDRALRIEHRFWWAVLPILSYYVTFVMMIGRNYDRFLLPVLLTLSLFAGFVVGRALRAAGRYGALGGVLAAVLFVDAGVYAGIVDLAMMRDARYAVERWLRANVREDALVVTIGRHPYMPRLTGLRTAPLEEPSTDIRALAPAYVVVNVDYTARFEPGSHEYEQYVALVSEGLGYQPVLDSGSWTLVGGLRLDRRFGGAPANIFTNLAKINPRMVVLERTVDSLR